MAQPFFKLSTVTTRAFVFEIASTTVSKLQNLLRREFGMVLPHRRRAAATVTVATAKTKKLRSATPPNSVATTAVENVRRIATLTSCTTAPHERAIHT